MWGLAAWVDRFQAELFLKQTGKPYTGRLGRYHIRAVWDVADQFDVYIGRGAKMDFKTKKAPTERSWVWQITPVEPRPLRKKKRSSSSRHPVRDSDRRD